MGLETVFKHFAHFGMPFQIGNLGVLVWPHWEQLVHIDSSNLGNFLFHFFFDNAWAHVSVSVPVGSHVFKFRHFFVSFMVRVKGSGFSTSLFFFILRVLLRILWVSLIYFQQLITTCFFRFHFL